MTLVADLLSDPLEERSASEKEVFWRHLEGHMIRFGDLQKKYRQGEARRADLESELEKLREALNALHAEKFSLKSDAEHLCMRDRHDPLTGLPNGAFFRERLEENTRTALEQHATLAVVYLDLDNFKYVNDTYGQAIGDAVLRIVGARLRRALRGDDVVSHLGDDLFACLIMGCQSKNSVKQIVDKVVKSLSAPKRVYSIDLAVQISVGIAMFPRNGTDAEALLRYADVAMQSAKEQGVGCVFVGDMPVFGHD